MIDAVTNFFSSLFGDKNQRLIDRHYQPVVDSILALGPTVRGLSDDKLRAKTGEFKSLIQENVEEIEDRIREIHDLFRGVSAEPDVEVEFKGDPAEQLTKNHQALLEELDELEEEWLDVVAETLEDLLPEVFAVIKEVCRRMTKKGGLTVTATDHDRAINKLRGYPHISGSVARWKNTWKAGGTQIKWEMIPYDVQLLGGVVLHRGNIAEMKTGEGKTLVAVAPVFLNALSGRGVHLVTVNPYLAQRDAEWMGPIFEFMGLTVDVIDGHQPHSPGRRKAYRADITYGTNNEFGFDYLRDNSFVSDPDHLVQRQHFFAIVDEVDSVLIDEARTPLIISGPVPAASQSRFDELKPSVERVVQKQKRLVAGFVSEAGKYLKLRDKALENEDTKKARDHEQDAGLALLRASRGFPRNKKLIKLLQEPGIEQLRQKTEFFYLQDNAKNMPIVDEKLHYALDEKQHAIEPTQQGREFIAKAAKSELDLFILPDVGEQTALFEQEYADKRQLLMETLQDEQAVLEEQAEQKLQADLADLKKWRDNQPRNNGIDKQYKAKERALIAKKEDYLNRAEQKRQNKIQNDLRVQKNNLEEQKRKLYTTYADRGERLHAIEQLLKAYTLYERDTEYIVENEKVQIVDKHTGRALPGRRYSDGLHQAIEAKEGVKVQAATQTYATITLQNYFRMYTKLAGMTGTAETEAEEFHKIYKMDVVVVPTNKPIVRDDMDDLIYRSRREKYKAVIERIIEYHKSGQPVLVGTTSVDVSETLSRALKRNRIAHNVLNAKRDRAKQESLIVAQAGQRGAVTIATNMAGRGTDIKLAPEVRSRGLAIVGTERHESRRIDLQLRGRSGRQGDPGESQFFLSLEDRLMRLFGPDRVASVMDRMKVEDDAVITHSWITKSIERAQKKVEQNNFAIRKRQLEYDDVLNSQREVIYDRRMHALKGERMRGEILEMLRQFIEDIVQRHHGDGNLDEMCMEFRRLLAINFEMSREEFFSLGDQGVTEKVFEFAIDFYDKKRKALAEAYHRSISEMAENDTEGKIQRISVDFTDGHRGLRSVVKVEDVLSTGGQEINNGLERAAVLSLIDERWTEHLRSLDEVKEGIGLRAYGQRDPLVEYKMEAFNLFSDVMAQISRDVVTFVFRAGPVIDRSGRTKSAKKGASRRRSRLDRTRATTRKADPAKSISMAGNSPNRGGRDPSARKKPVVAGERLGRNDLCFCGSGLKYKHCHARKG